MAVSNQYKVIVRNRVPRDERHLYTKQNLEALSAACRNLNESEFKLWIYLNKNADGYSFDLSPADFSNWSGVSESSYKRAKKGLVDKGYLVETGKSHYAFYEMPKRELEILPEVEEEFEVDDETPLDKIVKSF